MRPRETRHVPVLLDEVVSARADGSLLVDPVVTHTFTLEQGLEAFEVARDASVSGKVLLDFTPC